MTIYHAAAAIPARATGTAYAGIAPAATDDVYVKRIIVTNDAATASSVGLIRTATIGATPTNVLFQPGDPQRRASVTNLVTAWGTQPTIGTIYLRRYVIPAVAGAGIEWTFEPWEMTVRSDATHQLLLWNFGAATASAVQVSVTIDEQ